MADMFYKSVKESHNPEMWNTFTDMTEEHFDEIFSLALPELVKPFNINADDRDQDLLKQRRRRAASERTINFFEFNARRK